CPPYSYVDTLLAVATEVASTESSNDRAAFECRSEPQSQTRHPLPVGGRFSVCPRVVGAGTEAARPGDAHVWRETTPDFIAQAQAEFQVGQAAADAARRVVLAVEVGFQLGLEDQALGEQQFVAHAQACGGAAGRAGVSGRLDLEPVRRQALDAEGGP